MNEKKHAEATPESNPEVAPENQAENQPVNQPENQVDAPETEHSEAVAEDAGEQTTDQTAEATAETVSEEAAQIAQLQEELAAAQAKADEYLDKLQRTAAEFQNSRRRLENQLTGEVERANGALIHRLLPVLDDLDLAFQNVPSELQEAASHEASGNHEANGQQVAWVQGFRQIRKKLLHLLGEQGLEVIDTSGEFDPNQHEAIGSEPSDTVPSGHIASVMRDGYLYKGRVLRPALVRVAL